MQQPTTWSYGSVFRNPIIFLLLAANVLGGASAAVTIFASTSPQTRDNAWAFIVISLLALIVCILPKIGDQRQIVAKDVPWILGSMFFVCAGLIILWASTLAASPGTIFYYRIFTGCEHQWFAAIAIVTAIPFTLACLIMSPTFIAFLKSSRGVP